MLLRFAPELSSPLQARKCSSIFALTSVFQGVINSLCLSHLQDFYSSRWEKISKPFLFLRQVYLGSHLLRGNSQHCVLHYEWKPQTNSAETQATKNETAKKHAWAWKREEETPRRHLLQACSYEITWFQYCDFYSQVILLLFCLTELRSIFKVTKNCVLRGSKAHHQFTLLLEVIVRAQI